MIPKLRFSEFKDEWQEKRLGDISDFCSYGLNSAAKKFDGRNKYIRITDINEESREFSKNNLTSPSIINDKYLLDDDDIIFARTGASVGKTYLYTKNDGKVYFAGFLIKFSIKYANPYFIFLQTLQPKYKNWVKVMSTRSGQPGINADEYKTFKVVLPSKKEQEKIADFLRGGDERMVLLEKKVGAMREYKKGVMSAIFSGKLRFKDENGNPYPDWEERRLEDISRNIPSNITANNIGSMYSGRYIVYGASGKVGEIDNYQHAKAFTAIVKDGAGIGRIIWCEEKSSILGTLTAICPKNTINAKFLYYMLHQIKFEKYATGSTIPHIYYKDFSRERFLIPVEEEQRKIADFLSAIDRKIELEQTRLDRTKDFKKGLLQRMFV